MSLTVIVPSRGRPHVVPALAQAFRETCTRDDTELLIAIDNTDPTGRDYLELASEHGVHVLSNPSTSMVEALNMAAKFLLTSDSPEDDRDALGFMGDDHRPRSIGWDTDYLRALDELGYGIVYGNDTIQGQNLPTQAAVSSRLIRAWGWMAPPSLRHMFVDNFWRDLGQAAGCIRYLPKTIVEHVHPLAGKAAWDHNYVRVNALMDRDRQFYELWSAQGGFVAALERTRAVLGG